MGVSFLEMYILAYKTYSYDLDVKRSEFEAESFAEEVHGCFACVVDAYKRALSDENC